MKRGLFIFSAIIFGLGIMGISIFKAQPSIAVTTENQVLIQEAEESTSAGQTGMEETEDYSLPYPGLLPDHPLYFIKMIRDRVQLWLTRNTQRRAVLILHYADKRIASALALAEEGKAGAAVSTATKAEKYLEQAVEEAKKMDSSKPETAEFNSKLLLAIDKHIKVLNGIDSRIPNEVRQVLSSTTRTVQTVREQVATQVGERAEQTGKQIEEEMETDEEKTATEEGKEMQEGETEELDEVE